MEPCKDCGASEWLSELGLDLDIFLKGVVNWVAAITIACESILTIDVWDLSWCIIVSRLNSRHRLRNC